MDPKSPLASRTVWVNTLALLFALLAFAGVHVGVTPEAAAGVIVTILPVINIVLRFFTDRPIG